MHLLDALRYDKITMFKFSQNKCNFLGVLFVLYFYNSPIFFITVFGEADFEFAFLFRLFVFNETWQ